MKDKSLEEYVKAHKREFDDRVPSDMLWSRIDQALDKEKIKKPLGMRLWLGIAASLILVATITFMYTYRNHSKELEIADINPGYAMKEMRFASLIEEKKDSLQVYEKQNPALYAQFSSDLGKLGADYERLKQELQNSPNQKAVVKAMVKNMEMQLQVITQQLMIINEVNQYKKENQI